MPLPSADDLATAHRVFDENQTREKFYREATERVGLAISRTTDSTSLVDALAGLLKTWNRNYYRFEPFDEAHSAAIERLLAAHKDEIARARSRSIQDIHGDDEDLLLRIFTDFEMVLGPVGAAKALHLLAPNFFPLWDRKISKWYGLNLGKRGTNAGRYWQFVRVTQRQALNLAGAHIDAPTLLKALDEYNYCIMTKGWM